VASFGYTTLGLYRHYQFGGIDLTIFDQALWLLSRGEIPFVTARGFHIFANHAWFILFPLVPLYWLWSDARLLLLGQTLAIALGAIPVYLLAKDRLKNEGLALVFAYLYLTYRPLHLANVYEVHLDTFSVAPFLAALVCGRRQRWGPFGAWLLVALSCKEPAGLVVFVLGLYVAFTTHRRWGLVTAATGLTWFVLVVFFLLPAFSPAGEWGISTFYSRWGNSPGEIAGGMLTHPGQVLHRLLNRESLSYAVTLLAPLGFLSLLSPASLSPAGPMFVVNMLSDWTARMPLTWYASMLIPFLFVAAIEGLGFLQRGLAREDLRRQRLFVAGAVAFLLVNNLVLASPKPLLVTPLEAAGAIARSRGPTAQTDLALAGLEPEAVVSAHDRYLCHLAHRREIYRYPNPFWQQEYGLIPRSEPEPSAGELRRRIETSQVDYLVLDPRLLTPGEQETLQGLVEAGSTEGGYETVTRTARLWLLRKARG